VPSSLAELQELFLSLYGKNNFSVRYLDEEGDPIAITTDLELREVLDRSQGKLSLKLELVETEQVSFFDKIENLRQSLLESVSSPASESRQNVDFIPDSIERLREINSCDEEAPVEEKNNSQEKVVKKKEKKEKKPKVPKGLMQVKRKEKKEKKEKNEKKQQEVKKDSEIDPSAPVVHSNVTCDECHIGPIVGIRYKCTTCYDFDLCEECEASRNHSHPLIKIKTPMKTHPNGIWQQMNPIIGHFKQLLLSKVQKKDKQKNKKKFKVKVKTQEYPKEIPSAPGATVNVTWKVKNVGKKDWPAGTRLILDDGNFEFEDVLIPEVKAGKEIDINVQVNLNKNSGLSNATWRFVVGNKVFGKLKARFRVIDDGKLMVLVGNMGFEYSKAQKALIEAHGDLNLAVSQMFKF
jgi:hypothetical protein